MLEITHLYANYGAIEALHGISLYVKKGEMVALLGANGAGKSTTLMSIMRLPPPEAPVVKKGGISYNNVDLLKIPAHRIVAELGIALVPEGRRIFGNLTVIENLTIATYARKDKKKVLIDYDAVFSLFPRLKDRKHQRADTLSGGEQQMLAMGRAFMCGASFILLDEPSMGLAPFLMQELFRALKQLNDNGVTIFIVEQNASIALKYAHRAYVMETGQIVLEGTGNELKNNPEVRKAYIGS
ncbi:MAG: branched-chain amino acid transport system ATP-binding protein [Candidatus Magnetoglobus multicellularis str. Araruama]|uniref:Branched-chain amino acid transport system ATP-binding protein n=1 Tax=Candidatus Magnetoglobus multicellularis str. Araruama TaxID=890399 RepID=A0A1V1NXB1_9BACT|nr:MAG: branched-chain amino acid transport system ATP-binding protein [Candidatus Magnetoglobus multicellularis str. Araruama]